MDFGEVWRRGRWLVGEFEVGFENGIGEVGEFDERIKPSHPTWSRSEKLESDPRVLTRAQLLILLRLSLLLQVLLLRPGSRRSSPAAWRRSRSFYGESTVERKPRPRADRGILPARTGDSDEDYERSPLVWFSRKYRLRNFYFVFIFHFDFVVRVSISNGICISSWAWINFSCWVALFAKSITKVNIEIQNFFFIPLKFSQETNKEYLYNLFVILLI